MVGRMPVSITTAVFLLAAFGGAMPGVPAQGVPRQRMIEAFSSLLKQRRKELAPA